MKLSEAIGNIRRAMEIFGENYDKEYAYDYMENIIGDIEKKVGYLAMHRMIERYDDKLYERLGKLHDRITRLKEKYHECIIAEIPMEICRLDDKPIGEHIDDVLRELKDLEEISEDLRLYVSENMKCIAKDESSLEDYWIECKYYYGDVVWEVEDGMRAENPPEGIEEFVYRKRGKYRDLVIKPPERYDGSYRKNIEDFLRNMKEKYGGEIVEYELRNAEGFELGNRAIDYLRIRSKIVGMLPSIILDEDDKSSILGLAMKIGWGEGKYVMDVVDDVIERGVEAISDGEIEGWIGKYIIDKVKLKE